MKVDDDAVWNDYVKTGKIKGFSIDAFLTLKEVKLNSNKYKQMENNFKEAFSQFKTELKRNFFLQKKKLLRLSWVA